MTAVFKRLSASLTRHDRDMTEGSIVRHLLTFAFPLLLGNIFQQFYNMVDTWVVGNYVSNEAFSAVGSVGPITSLLIGFFTGLSSGAGAVISQYFGAKQPQKVRDTVHTAMLLTLLLGVVFTGVGVGMTPLMLRLMDTPPEVFPEAEEYLIIYFAGVLGLMIYNMGAGILRAVGDSVRPFLYLVVSALINTALDLVFVLCFDMGVAGVAYATIFAQGISALLVVLSLMRSKTCIRMRLRDLRIHKAILSKIVGIGFPAGLQMAITSFSNVFVQSYINYFGSDFMSGWTAYNKVDQLIVLPVQSVAIASTTFVAQNLGGGQEKRALRGMRIALAMGAGSMIVLSVPVMIFASPLVSFFNDKPEVVAYGTMLLRLLSPFYLCFCFNQIYAGALRGAGNSRAPMILMLFSFVVFRQIYLFVGTYWISNSIPLVALSYPAGWLVASISLMIYFRKVGFGKNRVSVNSGTEEAKNSEKI